MGEASKAFGASRIFDEYLGFGVFAIRMIHSLPGETVDTIQKDTIERIMLVARRKGDVWLPLKSNIETTAHFSRMLAPYAVFPIAPKSRFELMTGEYFLFIQLNVSGLARWLEKRGWRTEVLKPPDEFPAFANSVVIPALEVWKPSARKGIVIGWDILALAAMAFWMPESIERIVIAGLNEGIT